MFKNRWPPRPWEAPTARPPSAIFSAIGAWVTIGLGNLGLSLGAAMAIGGAVGQIAIGAALLGINYLISPRPPVMKTPQAQAVINQSIGPRVRGYGRALLGGTRAFFDSKSGALYQSVMMHSGQIDAIESVRIGDKTVATNGNGDVTTSGFTWSDRTGTKYVVRLQQYLGTPDQAADGIISGAFPGVWTSAHRLRGIAHIVAQFRSPPQEEFQKIFPEGYNTPVRGLCRLSRVFDPRTNVTAWSDNSALCILDYLTHPDGFRKTLDDIDLPSFIAFANLCDENVLRAAGGTEKRYRLWGVYHLTDEPEDVLRKMRATCDAELYQNAEGKIAIRGGRWQAPNVVITERDILGHTLEQGNDRFAAFNELKITYTSPQHDYQSIEATSWIDLADQDERGVLSAELDLDFVPSPAQARRLAKIHIAKSNPRWKGKIRTNLVGLDALGERTVQVILPELEINEAFYVAGFSIDPELKFVEIEIMTISEAAYLWDAAAEEGSNPAVPQDTTPDLQLPVPQNLILTNPSPGVIRADVDPPSRTGLELQAQVRAGAGSVWQDMAIEDDNLGAMITLPGGAYEVTARWKAPPNTAGDWSFPYATIDTREPVPPPVDIVVELGDDGETVAVTFRMPDVSANLLAKVWRVVGGGEFEDADLVSSGYGAPNASYTSSDLPGAGAWDYYFTAESGGARSVPAGPASVTVPAP